MTALMVRFQFPWFTPHGSAAPLIASTLLAALLGFACSDSSGPPDGLPDAGNPFFDGGTADASTRNALFEVEPDSLDFGVHIIGAAEVTQTLVVRNISPNRIGVGLVTGDFWDPVVFRFSNGGLDLEPGDSGTIQIIFTPERQGRFSTSLSLNTTSAEGRVFVEIPVVAEAYDGLIGVSDSMIDFGNRRVTTESVEIVQLTNPVSASVDVRLVPQEFSTRFCDGPSNSEPFCLAPRGFTVDSEGRFTLAAAETVELEVRYTPELVGVRDRGGFAVQGCDDGCEQVVTLQGLAVAGGLFCEPVVLDFGFVLPNASASETVQCTNAVASPTTIASWGLTAASAAEFSAEPSQTRALGAGESFDIELTFAPTALGDFEGVLEIREEGGPFPTEIRVEGVGGGPQVEVSPTALDFGDVTLIAPSRRLLRVSNVGFDDLDIRNVVVDTAVSGAFTSDSAGPVFLRPGEAVDWQITFLPTSDTVFSSSLSFDSNAVSVDVPLMGRGIDLPPCAFLVDPFIDFGSVAVNDTRMIGFDVENVGSTMCILTSAWLVPGSGASFSLLTNPRSVRFGPGASTRIEVQFTPARLGMIAGEVVLGLSSPAAPFTTVVLLGRGI